MDSRSLYGPTTELAEFSDMKPPPMAPLPKRKRKLPTTITTGLTRLGPLYDVGPDGSGSFVVTRRSKAVLNRDRSTATMYWYGKSPLTAVRRACKAEGL